MHTLGYRLLDWDSEFFGSKVALVTKPIENAEQLANLLANAKSHQIKLLYWPVLTRADEATESLIAETKGGLMDEKITFVIDLSYISAHEDITTQDVEVEVFSQGMPSDHMYDLAIQSGEQSRFAVDKNIPRVKYESLYKKWIESSVNKQLADEVLVIRDSDKVVGMVTLGKKNGRGDIGLLAVDRNYRGRKYGEALVRASLKWFKGNNYKVAQVVTQGKNLAACNLYKKCGFNLEKTEFYYHIWL